MKRTKIIATIGPVTESEEQLQALYDAGVNVIRFNFSHARYDVARAILGRIRKLNAEGKTNLSTLLDTKWPEIRSGDLEAKIQYHTGDEFRIYVDQAKMGTTEKELFCDYPYMIDMEAGRSLSMESGLFQVQIIGKGDGYLTVRAQNDCLIGSRRHINLPWEVIKMPGLTEQDLRDCQFAVDEDYDMIAMSFVRTGENVEELRRFLAERGAPHIKIISKIESQEWVDNMDAIVAASDGIMVARGDLGVEVPIVELPVYQRQIIEKTRHQGKLVIVATHLLETMIENPFPTRAEVSDIYNSVIQQTDCTMLSGETTIGKYPIEAVKMMTGVIESAEKHIRSDFENFSDAGLSPRDIEKKYLIRSALHLADELNAIAICVFTKSGRLARLASAFRPNHRVYAFTNDRHTVWYLNALYAIVPYYLEGWDEKDLPKNLDLACRFLREKQNFTSWDRIIAVNDLIRWEEEIPVLEILTIE